MAPTIPIQGLKPDEDYKRFPLFEIDKEFYDDFADITKKVRAREQWGAKPPKRAPLDEPLIEPVRFLVLSSFYSEQPGYPTRASVMQEMQRRDFARGLPDIQCNWAIGTDGLVYEARHWVYQPGNSCEYPGFEGHYAELTQFGDHRGDHYQNAFFNVIAKFNSRADWKALRPSFQLQKLKTPVPYVVFSSIRVTGNEKKSSDDIIREMQKRDMSLGMGDIQCNFVVTDDGMIWEGRGWDVRPGCDDDYPGYEGKFVEITNVGNFSTDKVRRSTSHLVDIGMLYEFLDRDLKQLLPDKRKKGLVVKDPPCPFEQPDKTAYIQS